MVYTIHELKQYIASNVDPNDFVELLNISTEDLVTFFDELIAEQYDYLVKELGLLTEIDEDEQDPEG